jgi:hypothetical protein
MKKSFLNISSIIIACIIIVGCKPPISGPPGKAGDGTYSTKVLPGAALSLKLPATLSPEDADKAMLPTACVSPPPAPGPGYIRKAGGYYMIKSEVAWLGLFAPTLEAYAILADAAISQNDLAPSPTPYEDLSVTFTQEMYDAIAASLPAWMIPPASLVVGKAVIIPSLTYQTDGEAPLPNSIIVGSGAGLNFDYAWSSDKTKLRMRSSCVMGPNSGTVAAVATDTEAKATAAKVTDSINDSLQFAIRRDSTSSANGVFVRSDCGFSNNSEFRLWGYADDDGGLVTTERTRAPIATETASASKYIEEGFGTRGALLYAATSTDGRTWSVCPDYDDTAPLTTYGEKAAAAESDATYKAVYDLLL